jgi:hypothetical protein
MAIHMTENEGFGIVKEFVCTAIPARSTEKRSDRATIKEPSILIRLVKRPDRGSQEPEGLSPAELYDATRSAWYVGKNRVKAQYAFAVARFRVLEVYRISSWHPQRQSNGRNSSASRGKVRYEFEGKVASDIRHRYIGKSVRHYFTPGARAPFIYVNLPGDLQ